MSGGRRNTAGLDEDIRDEHTSDTRTRLGNHRDVQDAKSCGRPWHPLRNRVGYVTERTRGRVVRKGVKA